MAQTRIRRELEIISNETTSLEIPTESQAIIPAKGRLQDEDTTTWEIPASTSLTKTVTGTITPSSNIWSFLEKLASGETKIDWRNVWVLLRAISIIAWIIFSGILLYRDNELGRLESFEGFLQFGYKVLLLSAIFFFFLILSSLIIYFIDRNQNKQKQPSKVTKSAT